MTSLVHYLEELINQLEHVELKQWLLHHFNKSALHLNELFTKQHSKSSARFTNWANNSNQHLLFHLIDTYGPTALLSDLHYYSEAFAALNFAVHHKVFLEFSHARLTAFHDAWFLIGDIIQKPDELITHLQQAERVALLALQELDHNWSLLVTPFLAKDSSELSAEKSKDLINYLRKPLWLRQMACLKKEASALLSLHWAVHAFRLEQDEIARLRQAQVLLSTYHFSFEPNTAKLLVEYHSAMASNNTLLVKKELIKFLALLLASSTEEQQFSFIQSLKIFYRVDLIEHCLKVQSTIDTEDAKTYQYLAILLCRHTAAIEKDRDVTRLQLVQFGQLPKARLSTKELNNPFAIVYALDQILRANDFIATATPQAIDSLSLRYRCLALTYQHHELMVFIEYAAQEISPYYYELAAQFDAIEQQLVGTPGDSLLIDKKGRLITWFIERMLHELISDLIVEYMQNPAAHQHALSRFFAYFCSKEDSLRSDLLFHAINFAYYQDGKASKGVSHAMLEQWRQSFNGRWDESFERLHPYLYSANGACIALVDELNRVWNLVADEPVLMGLGHPEYHYFNQQGQHVGNLTDSGHFRPSGIGQQLSTSILGVVPIVELEKSTKGLAWIIKHLLLEKSMPLLYEYKQYALGSPKWIWLQEQCDKALATITYPLPIPAVDALVTHVYGEHLFLIAPISACSANSLLLCRSYISRHTASWLSGDHTPEFHRFLEPLGSQLLADYLLHSYHKPWFAEGLALFASHPQAKQQGWLAQALRHLDMKTSTKLLSKEIWNAILFKLSDSEHAVQVVLALFGQDNLQQSVQEVNHELDNILHYFERLHLMALIRCLISMQTWSDCQQYRFALLLLQAQHHVLFQPNSRGLLSWSKEDVSHFSLFIHRHLEEKHPWDRNASLGFKLLGALTLQYAQQGQNTLFWQGQQKLSRVAAFLVSPVILEQLVDKFILPRFSVPHEAEHESRNTANQRRQYRERLISQLPDNTVLRDWHQLIGSPDNKQQIPLLGVYLLHYSGDAKAVRQLAEQYFLSVEPGMQARYIYPLSHWLENFSGRDISGVLFDSLQRALIRKPALLDATILTHCAQFWAVKKELTSQTRIDLKLLLIKQWGKAKHYDLVACATQVLLYECQDKAVQQRLIKAQIEAQLEAKLLQLLKDYPKYAASVSWLKRVWNYGLNWRDKRSELVELADTQLKATSRLPTFSPRVVSAGVTKQVEPFMPREHEFVNLLTQVIRSSFHSPVAWQISHPFGLFTHGQFPGVVASAVSRLQDVQENDASKQSMAHV